MAVKGRVWDAENAEGEVSLQESQDLHASDDYIRKHPDLYARDSEPKSSEILPFVDRFMESFAGDQVKLLDVGGGAGLILRRVAQHIESKHRTRVVKFALDLSQVSMAVEN